MNTKWKKRLFALVTIMLVILFATVSIAYGCFEDVLVTKEWTPLDKGVVENKYYAKGVGFIFAVMVKGGDEPT